MNNYQRVMVLTSLLLWAGTAAISQNKEEKVGIENKIIKLFLSGDVMTGRGIDQVLPASVDPILHEAYVKDARDYVLLAERENGKIKQPVSYQYIWGDAFKLWKQNAPDLKLINLETSITTSNQAWPGKGIHYRMHPENLKVLTTAGIDQVSLANNHSLDWGRKGLEETMKSLRGAGISFSGVGNNEKEAAKASILETEKGRVLVFSYGMPNSGVFDSWAAGTNNSGVNYLPGMSEKELSRIKEDIARQKQAGDLVILSVHWGGNWGYDISQRQREFAHQLIDQGIVDVIFGHSSHHPMGMEVYQNKLIIYGAGDFINDYEGISGHEEYRGDLSLMYFPEIDMNTGQLISLEMYPMKIKNFRLHRASKKDVKWLQKTLSREGKRLGTSLNMDDENALWLQW
ncbi:CapA family protein [Salegentibacter flavus]|uniref:Poly-gamma-glutamate synthesis protein (Capsule biosynthesis protein) n=1 Tax=Salegentibacter flavus TaxID=287099 RepID=A0A1I5BV59_9FLAO|nr:CapA family protein [Salegentibacter flavus]SFN78646.1 poly-gamma-glutamate synthesis protein (capsule biosynthesis protein) [Salegentibacter flavus]